MKQMITWGRILVTYLTTGWGYYASNLHRISLNGWNTSSLPKGKQDKVIRKSVGPRYIHNEEETGLGEGKHSSNIGGYIKW